MCFHSCIYICIYRTPPLTPKPAHPGAGMLVFTHPKGCHSQHPCTRPHGRAPVRPSPFRAVPRTSLCNPPRLGTCLNRAHVTHGPLDNAACMQYGLGGICAFTCSQCDAMHSPPPPLFCMQPFTCSCVAHATCVAHTESPRDPRGERKGGWYAFTCPYGATPLAPPPKPYHPLGVTCFHNRVATRTNAHGFMCTFHRYNEPPLGVHTGPLPRTRLTNCGVRAGGGLCSHALP